MLFLHFLLQKNEIPLTKWSNMYVPDSSLDIKIFDKKYLFKKHYTNFNLIEF